MIFMIVCFLLLFSMNGVVGQYDYPNEVVTVMPEYLGDNYYYYSSDNNGVGKMAQKPSQQQLTAARCKPYVNAACSDLFQACRNANCCNRGGSFWYQKPPQCKGWVPTYCPDGCVYVVPTTEPPPPPPPTLPPTPPPPTTPPPTTTTMNELCRRECTFDSQCINDVIFPDCCDGSKQPTCVPSLWSFQGGFCQCSSAR